MQSFWKNPLGALPLMFLLASFAGAAFGAAGNVQFVIGDVKLITKSGETKALVKGAEINEGDRIVTAAGASAQLKMVDGGFIAVRPNTSMTFDTYHYSGKEDGKESAVVSLLQGGFRTITGIIGHTHKQNYLIKTETATIGIRGTDHEPMVILPPLAGQVPIAPPGTYDKVNVGVAFIANDSGTVDIQRNQVGFAPLTKAAPVVLPRIPPFYKPTPAPGPQKAKEEEKADGKGESQQAAAAPAEKAAEATASSRDTAAVDPNAGVATGPSAAPVAAAPAPVTPVVAITATSESGATLNTTTQTQTTSTGVVVPVTTLPTNIVNFTSSSVLRDEISWSTTQIAPGVDPLATTYTVSDKNRNNLVNNLGGTSATPVALNGPTTNTNFLFDGLGNLTQVLDTPHVVFDHGNDVPGSSTQFTAPTPLAHAQLAFSGGAAAESYYDPTTGIRLGRWSGGVINITDLATGTSYVESLLAPGGAARSAQWVVAQMPSSLPLGGEFLYTRANGASGTPSFATAPTDSYGNVGILDSAGLRADFTNMRVTAGVRVSMPSGPAGSFGTQEIGAIFTNAPISNGGFNVSSGSDNPVGTDNLHVGCNGAGCAPNQTYGGRIRGGFTSATGNAGTADGAFFRYTFNTNYGAASVTPPTGRVVDDYINGLVAFQQGPQIALPTSAAYPAAAPTAPVVVAATYAYNPGLVGTTYMSNGETYWADHPQGSLVTDAAGNLVSIAEANTAQHGDGHALALSGGTASPAAPTTLAIGNAANANDGTILLGWQGSSPNLTVSGSDFNGCFGTSGCTASPSPRSVLGDGLSWVRGPAPYPDYLPGAIAGYSNSLGPVIPSVAAYTLGASILHDQNGASGTVNSAALAVNFNTSAVSFGMAATTAAGTWTASASNVRMSQEGSFSAFTGASGTINSGSSIAPTTTHQGMTVSFSGGSNAFGNINGQLMGIGLSGAGVAFSLNDFSSCSPSGTCINNTASGALAFSNALPYSTLTPYQLLAFTTGMNAAGQFDQAENYRIQGGFSSPFRTQTVNGFPVKLDSEMPIVTTISAPCTINCGPFVSDIPVTYAAAGATGPASIGTATLLESGYDPASGIRWGRYGNGTIGVSDRISGASLGTIDVTKQNSHFVLSSQQSGPIVLPTTGTFNYTFVGGTSPTDSNGNVGAALSAANASLTANFTAQTVDTKLSNLVVGGNTWSASATGAPIVGSVFQAEKKLGGTGNLAVTSSLGTSTSGTVVGGFTSSGGGGVGMLYSLNHGGNIATNPAAVTVSGVAVFKR
jgi:hypothetical protein